MSLSERFNITNDIIDFSRYRANQDARYIKQIHELKEDFMAELEDPSAKGKSIPWTDKIKIRPREVSVWAGINNHGKSTMLLQTILWLAFQGSKAMIASFEMPPVKSISKMFHQFHGKGYEHESEIDEFSAFARDKLWFYEQNRTLAPQRVMDLIRYAKIELGVDQIVIDSMMKCGIHTEDLKGQKSFIDWLCTFSKDNDCHIHLVTHSRKKENDRQMIGKFDIKGAGELSDMPDNVFIVWRNEEPSPNGPDGVLMVAKQRHGECWIGRLDINYHKTSSQFVLYPSCRAIPFPGKLAIDF